MSIAPTQARVQRKPIYGFFALLKIVRKKRGKHQGCAHYRYDVKNDEQLSAIYRFPAPHRSKPCRTATPYTASSTRVQRAQLEHLLVRYKRAPRFPDTVPTMLSSLKLRACHHNRATSVPIRLVTLP